MDKQNYGGKGAITECLIFKTIEWYTQQNIAYFKKSYAPFVYQESNVQYIDKGDVDFYGVYQGKYISFEVKETKKSSFMLSQIKKHQLQSLQEIKQSGGISFLILNFCEQDNNVWLIGIDKLMELTDNKIKQITVNNVHDFGINIPIEYPGILDWIRFIDQI